MKLKRRARYSTNKDASRDRDTNNGGLKRIRERERPKTKRETGRVVGRYKELRVAWVWEQVTDVI